MLRYRMCLALGLLPLSGCAYLNAQAQLLEQARKGVELVSTAQAEHSALIEQFAQLRRDRLDEGFDADVREQPALSADWVIEARKGYAAGLDALAKWHADETDIQRAASANLKAVDMALQRLQWLEQAATGWMERK